MNTSEIVKAVAGRLELTRKDTGDMLKTTVGHFRELLADKKAFTIPELGTFDTHLRQRRRAFLPFYRKMAMLPPKRVVDFRPNQTLKEEVKGIEVK